MLLLSALGLFPVERAITIVEVVAFLFLFLFGYGWLRQLISGLLLIAIGGLIVGIKAVFH